MKTNNVLIVVAIIAVTFAVVNLIIQYEDITELTGFSTSTKGGTANVTIIAQASVTFATASVEWGIGAVNDGDTSSLLDTSNNSVADGNWTAVSQALVLRNDGNSNVSVTLTSSTASAFIGGSTVSPTYKLMVSTTTGNVSCDSEHNKMTAYTVVTGSAQDACTNLSYYNDHDNIDIDVQLRIPADAAPGVKGAVVTAIATVL